MKTLEEQLKKAESDYYSENHHGIKEYTTDFSTGAKWMQERLGWIDVYDRLPESESEYLVCLHNNEVVTVHFYFDEDTNSFNTYGIKYWMPLPEPPEDKSGTSESA